ncbi:MAG: hypothetical protein ACRD2N_01395 [Vicinamibacterales bacterium]
MRLFLCRWSNGDCSVVWARNKEDAIIQLDQIANAEGCPIAQVDTFQVHFTLTDRGELALDGFGEGTKEEIVSCAYPLLDKALQAACGDADDDGYESLSSDRRAAIAHAVEQERGRIGLDDTQTTKPQTELGHDVKHHTDMPAVLIDRMVRNAATKTLKKFKGRGKLS